jgi:UDP-N-acetylmuramoyl-tripeptide--D-alanyl-D-alanine ligase
MSISLTKTELAKILNARLTNNNALSTSTIFKGVEFNSRDIKGGELFIALKGGAQHGHDFLNDAFRNGAALALVENEQLLADPNFGDKVMVVPDTLKAFIDLARYHRERFSGEVVGVAGSVGKTTTKDLLGRLASRFCKTSWSKRSFNNLLGLSYTICNADLADRLWVLELGMNHAGELAELSQMAKPDIGVLTKLAPEHLEFFRDLDQVADAEYELLSGLNKSGARLVINADCELSLSALQRSLKRWGKEGIEVKTFGHRKGDMQVSDFVHLIDPIAVNEGCLKARFSLRSVAANMDSEPQATIVTDIIGRHNSGNLAAAILILKLVMPEVSLAALAGAVSDIPPSPMRLNQYDLTAKGGGLLIDDSYNSSPDAVLAALDILGDLKGAARSVALVLGDMYELGDSGARLHLALAQPIIDLGPRYLLTYGELMGGLAAALKGRLGEVLHAQTVEEMARYVQERPVDVVLIKASRGVGLDRVVRLLVE